MRIYNDEDRHSNRISPSPATTRKNMGEIREQKSEWDNEYNIFLENFTQEDKKFIDLIVNSQTENKEINGNTF